MNTALAGEPMTPVLWMAWIAHRELIEDWIESDSIPRSAAPPPSVPAPRSERRSHRLYLG
jgi:hypothetical protein